MSVMEDDGMDFSFDTVSKGKKKVYDFEKLEHVEVGSRRICSEPHACGCRGFAATSGFANWIGRHKNNSSKGIFEMEQEDVNESTDHDLNHDSELPRQLSLKNSEAKVFAEKLDSLMVLIFEHLESCGGRLIQIFQTLVDSFMNTVLTAYKLKFSQFVIFYACALDPGNCGVTFALKLEDKFFCSTNFPNVRMSIVAYLASYLSRAKFLSVSVVPGTLERLVDWCVHYVKMQDDEINPEAHRIFYSGC